MNTDTVFETTRLILRPFVMEDLQAVFERASDPEVMRFQNCGTRSLEQTKASLEKCIQRADEMLPYGIRAIVLRSTGKNVGYCKLGPLPVLEGNPIEISYEIAREHWGEGFATEAASRLVRHGIEDLRLPEIVAAINPRNIASARVVEKMGFTVREKVEWPEQGLVDLYIITS